MSDLPKCRLCGAAPEYGVGPYDREWAFCATMDCQMYGTSLLQVGWRALMAPPAVTEAMVTRGMSALPRYAGIWTQEQVGRSQVRAVLEAAMGE